MAKGAYVGVSDTQQVYVTITSDNIGDYFTVTNSSYYFVNPSTSYPSYPNRFATNNGSVKNSTASTTLTALADLTLSFKFGWISTNTMDTCTLIVNGENIKYNAACKPAGETTWSGTLAAGQQIKFIYKRSSYPTGSGACYFDDMQIAVGEQVRENVACKVKSIYVGVNGVALIIRKAYVGVDGVAQLVFGG